MIITIFCAELWLRPVCPEAEDIFIYLFTGFMYATHLIQRQIWALTNIKTKTVIIIIIVMLKKSLKKGGEEKAQRGRGGALS